MKEISRYLLFVNLRKIPSKMERDIFIKMINELNVKLESKKDLKIPLNIYTYLKKINKVPYS
jgi:hypothetical protein